MRAFAVLPVMDGALRLRRRPACTESLLEVFILVFRSIRGVACWHMDRGIDAVDFAATAVATVGRGPRRSGRILLHCSQLASAVRGLVRILHTQEVVSRAERLEAQFARPHWKQLG